MPTPIDPRGKDNPSTYFVSDSGSEVEMIRLIIQDNVVTAGMGGPLAEQPKPEELRRVLDIGCGPGGWILEAATAYPLMSLVGIDISWKMIEYARAQAQARQLNHATEFHVMDARRPLEFPDASFDLVNLRFGGSYLRVSDWPPFLRELARVTCPGGVLRVTEGGLPQSNSPAQMRFSEMLSCAATKAGYGVTLEYGEMQPALIRLLNECGYQIVQSKVHVLEHKADTVAGQSLYQDAIYGFQSLKPFLQKMGCAPENYDEICQQALIEMQQKDFRGTWKLTTAWGTKPLS